MPRTVPSLGSEPPSSLPFSKVVEANGLVFLSGQIGDVPGTEFRPADIETETRAALDNVGRLLRAVGLDYGDVVRCTIYIVDFDEFARMNAVYREYFPTEPPARATVEVTRLALGARIEIETTAAR